MSSTIRTGGRTPNTPDRRAVLRGAGVIGATAAATPLLSACDPGESSDDPIRIGGMWLMSGSLSTYGEYAREGAELAVQEINDAGGVLGRSLEMVFEDEEDADTIVQVARRLAFEEEVDFLMGLDSSGTAQALVPTVPELDRVLMLTHAASIEVTGEACNRNTFRCIVNIPQNTYAAAQLAMQEHGDVASWTTIGPDYAFGYEIWEYFQHYLDDAGHDVEFGEPIYPPLENEDFTSHITQALDSDIEGVLVTVWGADLVNFVRQATDLGFFEEKTVLFQLGAAMEVLDALGDEMPTGIWAGTRYWWASPDTDTNNAFVDAYEARYDHKPSYNAQGAYIGVHMLAQATEDAGSTDTDAVIEALEGMEYEAPQGPTRIRPEDHQAVVDVTWGLLAEGDDGTRVLDPLHIVPGDEATLPPEETGCAL